MAINVDRIKRFVELISNKNQNGQFTIDRFNLALQQAETELFNEYYGLPQRSQNGRSANDMYWQSTERMSNNLVPFLKKVNININAQGEAKRPLDFCLYSSMRASFVSDSNIYKYKESQFNKETKSCIGTIIDCKEEDDCFNDTQSSSASPSDISTSDCGKEVEVEFLPDSEIGQRLSSSILYPSKSYPAFSVYDSHFKFYPCSLGIAKLTYLRYPAKPEWKYKTNPNGRPVYDPAASIDSEWGENNLNEIAVRVCSYLGIHLSRVDLLNYAEAQQQNGI